MNDGQTPWSAQSAEELAEVDRALEHVVVRLHALAYGAPAPTNVFHDLLKARQQVEAARRVLVRWRGR
jgi:hypothetical protein